MTIKELKELINGIPDDFIFEIEVLQNNTPDFFIGQKYQVKKQDYDIGWSDKKIKLTVKI